MAGLLVAVAPHVVSAQTFEIGIRGGVGCLDRDNKICGGTETAGLISGYGSIWLSRHLEAQLRVARMSRDELVFEHGPRPDIPFPDGIVINWTDRSRTLLFAQVLYHFSTARVRPYIGVGLGRIRDRSNRTCTPAGCESSAPPWLAGANGFGKRVDYSGEWVLSFGVQGRLAGPTVVRGAVTLHNFGGEQFSTTELSAGIGIRF